MQGSAGLGCTGLYWAMLVAGLGQIAPCRAGAAARGPSPPSPPQLPAPPAGIGLVIPTALGGKRRVLGLKWVSARCWGESARPGWTL